MERDILIHKKKFSSSTKNDGLTEKRVSIYSQVAEPLLEIEDALDSEDREALFSFFTQIRRIIRTNLPFLTEQIFFELEQLEALILPYKKSGLDPDFSKLTTRFSVFHVQLSRSLQNPEVQNMESILSLPKKVLQEIENSEKRFTKAKNFEENQEKATTLAKEAEIQVGNKKYSKAIKLFLKAIELLPDQPVYHNDLGVVYSFNHQPKKAKKEYELAIDLNQKFPDKRTSHWTLTYFNLAKIYQKLGDQNLEKKDELEKAKENYSKSLDFLEEYLQVSPQGNKVKLAHSIQKHLREELVIIENALVRLQDEEI